jgi:8-oxo-dGTP pyrophosphatase MutT (NUDIX family)
VRAILEADTEMNDPDFAHGLRAALTRRRRESLAAADASPAAVLVPLFLVDDTVHVLYTKRTETVPHHQGQIAFPGGRLHPEDPSAARAAVREAHEEIGLRPEDVDVLGALDDIHTIRTRFVITPFVALVPHPYAFRPNPPEVAEIFAVPLPTLQDPATHRQEIWHLEGLQVPVHTIHYRGHVIWGATERITRNFLDVVATLRDSGGG